jgi:hypothetical protein
MGGFCEKCDQIGPTSKGVISEHQYGCSHRTCISPILNKLLIIQILIQKQTNGIIFDNNDKGCYNRIISKISLASIRRLRSSKNLVRMLGKLWEQLEHHISMGYGISEAYIVALLTNFGMGSGKEAAARQSYGHF